MTILNYSKSYEALQSFVKDYNTAQTDIKTRIRANTYATAREIIRLYGKELLKDVKNKGLDLMHLTPLSTNNCQLASLMNCSPRTIQRHIQRLILSGIIKEKKWRGRTANYLLWINPNVLFINDQVRVKYPKNQLKLDLKRVAENECVTSVQRSICPHSDTSNNTGNIINRIIAVDKRQDQKHPQSTSYETCHTLQRSSPSLTNSTHTGYKTRNTGENGRKNLEGAGENERLRTGRSKEMNAPKNSPERTASLSFYVQMLWLLAQKLLYRDAFLTDYQHQVAKELLTLWYEPVPDKYLADVHQIYTDRIGLVRKYLNRHPQWSIQLPHLYFDPKNAVGFAGTKVWYYKHIQRKKEVRNRRIVHNQIRKFLNNDTQSATARKPPIPLYLECKNRVLELGDPELLKVFDKAIISSSFTQPIEFYA